MKTTKKVLLFLFKVSGVLFLYSSIDSAVFRYRLRIRMVPVSFKVFIWSLGVVSGASGVFVSLSYENVLESNPIAYERPSIVETVKASEVEEEKAHARSIDELSDYIWMKESSRGINNFTKCEAIGKINGIGYAIPGDGSFLCFESHEDEMTALKGWIAVRKASGWSEKKMLCTYSGNNYSECQ